MEKFQTHMNSQTLANLPEHQFSTHFNRHIQETRENKDLSLSLSLFFSFLFLLSILSQIYM